MKRRLIEIRPDSPIAALVRWVDFVAGRASAPRVRIPRGERAKGPERLVLHVGAHKTGSSSLQQLLQQLGPELAEQGVFAFGRHIPRSYHPGLTGRPGYDERIKPHLRVMRTTPLGSEDYLLACRRFVEVIEGAAGGAPTIVYSDEYTLGRRVRNNGGLYPLAARQLRTLRDIFPDRRVEVILYVRSPDRYVEASYLQDIKDGVAEPTFDAYLKKHVDLDALSWLDLADRIADVVGRDCVHVEQFERIKEGGFVPYARRFLDQFADSSRLSIPTIAANPSFSAEGAKLAQQIRARVTAGRWPQYRRLLAKDFNSKTGEAAVYFTESERAALLKRYSGDAEAAEAKYPFRRPR